MFGKKKTKTKTVSKSVKTQTGKSADKSVKTQAGKTAGKSVKTQTGKSVNKNAKTQTGKPAAKGGKTQDRSEQMLAKLMAIEKEARLEQARDSVDQLEDEKIAENIELLLKIMRSEK